MSEAKRARADDTDFNRGLLMEHELFANLFVTGLWDLFDTHAHQNVREYARFLVLKAIAGDTRSDPTTLAPSPRIEVVWKTHMLLPHMYVKACDTLGCGIIGYDERAENDSTREECYAHTLGMYETVFGTPAPNYWWPPRVYSNDSEAE